MTQTENKILMENLPVGSMKSDVENILKGWIKEVAISKIDLVDNKKRKCKTAFVALSCYSEVEQIIDFYNANFDDQGFAFEDGFANVGMLKVKKYTKKPKSKIEDDMKVKPSHDEEKITNQITERLFSPAEENWDDESVHEVDTSNIVEDQIFNKSGDNSSSQTLMFQQLPGKTTKTEVEELINQLRPKTKIINIDLKTNTRYKFKLNAFVRFESQSDCNAIMNIYQEKYGEKGYLFVNQDNKSSTFNLAFYYGKKKEAPPKVKTEKKIKEFHIYLEKVPSQTSNEEISSIINKCLPPSFAVSNVAYHKDDKLWHVKLPSWEACDIILTHFKENFLPHGGYAFQNAKGRFNLINFKRNESFYAKSTRQTFKSQNKSNDTELLKCTPISSCSKELHQDLNCSSPLSMSSSNEWKSMGDNNNQAEEIPCNSASSSFSQPSQASGSIDPYLPPNNAKDNTDECTQQGVELKPDIILEDNVAQELNNLMYEKEELDDFRREIMLLEDELKTKCPELFVSEMDLMLLRVELDKMETKKTELLTLRNIAQSELDELKEQVECLNEGDI